jgi:hypothetical protein
MPRTRRWLQRWAGARVAELERGNRNRQITNAPQDDVEARRVRLVGADEALQRACSGNADEVGAEEQEEDDDCPIEALKRETHQRGHELFTLCVIFGPPVSGCAIPGWQLRVGR